MIGTMTGNGSFQILLLSMVPGVPLLVAGGLLVPASRALALRWAPWTALPALAAALLVSGNINLEVAWFFMGGRMGIDSLGRSFLLLAALVWLLAAFFGRGYLSDDDRRYRFFFFYLISMAFNFGLILAQDMLGFYLFFGLMSVSAYGLIVHNGSAAARRAGQVYIVLVMVGEVLLFSGMVLMACCLPDLELATITSSRAGNLSLTLLFIGFGIKAGLLPLHVWLPLAHPVAPVPASAVLSGVMIKAGLLGWLRFLPMGQEVVLPGWGGVLVGLGLTAALYGVIVGLTQQEAKTVLAYSSISQMGLMTMLVGCGLLAPQQWPQVTSAVALYALHHGLAKASLFLATGLGPLLGGKGASSFWRGLLLVPALALAGLPFTSGAIAKYSVKEVVHGLPPAWAALLAVALPLAALATTCIVGHFLRIVFATRPSSSAIPPVMRRSWLMLLALVVLLLWLWPQQPLYGSKVGEGRLFWQGLWPVLSGLLILAAAWRWWPASLRLRLPAGDLLWLVWRRPGMPMSGPQWERGDKEGRVGQRRLQSLLAAAAAWGRQVEKRLMRWTVVGMAYLLLCLLLMASLAN